MNRTYDFRRKDVLTAIRNAGWFIEMKSDLPPDESAGEGELTVPNTRGDNQVVVFRVLSSGVANRIQARCPHCATWMRFSGLKQHVHTRKCEDARAKRIDQDLTNS
jgi:hypothetical protein